MARKEVRIALVMNGGISLAVWMGGVTHELELLRRASAAFRQGLAMDAADDPWAPADAAERHVYRAWRELCESLDCSVTIDVIAGSSAGGLNGTLLAQSIASGAHLPVLRDVWGKLAALEPGKLLRSPGEPHDSVLDGAFFRSEVSKLVESTRPTVDPGAISLFVTATAVRAGGRRWQDCAGRDFTVADHRRLYRFRRRPTWELDADRENVSQSAVLDEFQQVDALVAAARASAGFPVAFAPIPEATADYDLRDLRDTRIGEPGAEVKESSTTWLMDGGVLDNAPFGPVLEEVSQQNVDAPWRRVVVYVVPSGDPAPPPPQRLGDAAPPWTTTIGATVWFPREVDIRGDIEQVDDLLKRTARWVQAPDELFNQMMVGEHHGSAADTTNKLRAAAAGLSEQYRQSRTRAGVLDAINAAQAEHPVGRLAAQPDIRVDAVESSNWVPPPGSAEEDMTSSGLEPWRWGTAVADRTLRLLLRHLTVAADGSDPEACAKAIDKIGDLVQQCVGLRSAIETHVVKRLRESPAGTLSEEHEAARAAIEDAVESCNAPTLLGRIMREAAEAYQRAMSPKGLDAREILSRALMVEVVTRAFADRERFDRPVNFEFRRFGPDCSTGLFDIPRCGGTALGDWKLWGTHFGHFGAFGAAAWRRWDWRWGRLDGASHLFDLLTSDPEQPPTQDLKPERDRLLHAILACEQDGPDVDSTLKTMESTLNNQLCKYRDRDRELLALSREKYPEIGQAANDTVRATLQLLRHNDPNIPPYIRTAGLYISYALWPRKPHDHKPGRGVTGILVRTGLRRFGKKARDWIYN